MNSKEPLNLGGDLIRRTRESRGVVDIGFSLRKFAGRLGVEPSYLSKIERGLERSPSEDLLVRIAKELGLDEVVLLASFGRIPSDVREIIMKRPEVFTQLIRSLRDAPDSAMFEVVRRVSDGQW